MSKKIARRRRHVRVCCKYFDLWDKKNRIYDIESETNAKFRRKKKKFPSEGSHGTIINSENSLLGNTKYLTFFHILKRD